MYFIAIPSLFLIWVLLCVSSTLIEGADTPLKHTLERDALSGNCIPWKVILIGNLTKWNCDMSDIFSAEDISAKSKTVIFRSSRKQRKRMIVYSDWSRRMPAALKVGNSQSTSLNATTTKNRSFTHVRPNCFANTFFLSLHISCCFDRITKAKSAKEKSTKCQKKLKT